jgi:predicted ATPase
MDFTISGGCTHAHTALPPSDQRRGYASQQTKPYTPLAHVYISSQLNWHDAQLFAQVSSHVPLHEASQVKSQDALPVPPPVPPGQLQVPLQLA